MEDKLIKIISKGGDIALVLIVCIAMFTYLYIKIEAVSANVVVHTEQMADLKTRHMETEALLQEIRANVAYIKGKLEYKE